MIYYLKPGKNSIGQSELGENEIILSGLGVKDHHCDLSNNDGRITICPALEAEVFVNGELLKEERELTHGDRVILGNNHIFRFNNPQASDDAVKRRGASVDWTFAQKEFAQVQGNLNSMIAETHQLKTQPNLQAELLKAFQLTNEANAISQALNRSVVFNLELATHFPKESTEEGAAAREDFREIGWSSLAHYCCS